MNKKSINLTLFKIEKKLIGFNNMNTIRIIQIKTMKEKIS